MTDLEKLNARSYAQAIGKMRIRAEKIVAEELINTFATFKKKSGQASFDFDIQKAENFEKTGEAYFVGTTREKLIYILEHLYEKRDGVNWKLLESADYEIDLEYTEWSVKYLGNFIRKAESRMLHVAGESMECPRVEEISSGKEYEDSWANRLKFGLAKDIVAILDDEITFAEYAGSSKEDAPFQVGIKLLTEKEALEAYFGKSLSEISKESSFQNGSYKKEVYKLIFSIANNLK